MNASLTLTERAAQQINAFRNNPNQPKWVRLSVHGGGCAGFAYTFESVDAPSPEDVKISAHGATLLVDTLSMPFLIQATVDYEDSLLGSMFTVNNPSAKSSCSCGVSFSL